MKSELHIIRSGCAAKPSLLRMHYGHHSRQDLADLSTKYRRREHCIVTGTLPRLDARIANRYVESYCSTPTIGQCQLSASWVPSPSPCAWSHLTNPTPRLFQDVDFQVKCVVYYRFCHHAGPISISLFFPNQMQTTYARNPAHTEVFTKWNHYYSIIPRWGASQVSPSGQDTSSTG